MKIFGVTEISSDGDILVTREDGTKEWVESYTKLFLKKEDCIEYAISEMEKAFDSFEFETEEDNNERTKNEFASMLKEEEDICIQGSSSHIIFEYFTQEIGLYPVVCHYSFDCDVPVTLYGSEEEAKQALREDYAEECRIQTEENGHEAKQDLNAKISDDGSYAEIMIDAGTGEEPDKIEWSIGREIREVENNG